MRSFRPTRGTPMWSGPRRLPAPVIAPAEEQPGSHIPPGLPRRRADSAPAFAALLLTFGSLSDRFGRKRTLLAGLAVFGLASVAGGFTTGPGQIAALGHPGLGQALQHTAASAFLRGLTAGCLVAGAVAATGALLAVLFLPAQPAPAASDEAETTQLTSEGALA